MFMLFNEIETFLFNALKDVDFSSYTPYLPNGDSRNLMKWSISNQNSPHFFASSFYFGDDGDSIKEMEIYVEVDILKNSLKIISLEEINKQDSHIPNC